MTAFSTNRVGQFVTGEAGYDGTGCPFSSFSAYLVKLKARGLLDMHPQSLLSQKVHHFSCLKVNCRNKMQQRMNMYPSFIVKQVWDKLPILCAPFFFIAVSLFRSVLEEC